jgi:hypothetical protein
VDAELVEKVVGCKDYEVGLITIDKLWDTVLREYSGVQERAFV